MYEKCLSLNNMPNHFFYFFFKTLFLIWTLSNWFPSNPSSSLLARSSLLVLKVYKYFPLLILNFVTLLFFLINTAEFMIHLLFLAGFVFASFASLAVLLPFAISRNFLKSVISLGWVSQMLTIDIDGDIKIILR